MVGCSSIDEFHQSQIKVSGERSGLRFYNATQLCTSKRLIRSFQLLLLVVIVAGYCTKH